MTEQERQLVEQAAAGDNDAFERLVTQYEKMVYSIAFRMAGNEEDALDLSQETFIKVWKSLPFFKFEASLSTWVYRIAVNVCLDFLRQQKRRRFTTISEDEIRLELPDRSQDLESTVLDRVEQKELIAALATLEPEFRAPLAMSAITGMSYREIAEALDIQPGTVKSRVSRARERLRKKLSEHGNRFPICASKKRKGGEDA